MNPAPDRLDAQLAALQPEVPLRRDLWPQIMPELSPRAAERSAQPSATGPKSAQQWFVPAALAAGIAVLSTILWLRQPLPPSSPPVAALRPTSPPVDPADFSRVRAALQADFAAAVEKLAPETRERVLRNLEIIRKAEADIAAALAEDPSNPLLLELRQRTHEHEVDLMTSLPPANPLPPSRNKI